MMDRKFRTGKNFLYLIALVRAHTHNAAYAFFVAGSGVKHVASRFQMPRVDAEETQPANKRVGSDFKS